MHIILFFLFFYFFIFFTYTVHCTHSCMMSCNPSFRFWRKALTACNGWRRNWRWKSLDLHDWIRCEGWHRYRTLLAKGSILSILRTFASKDIKSIEKTNQQRRRKRKRKESEMRRHVVDMCLNLESCEGKLWTGTCTFEGTCTFVTCMCVHIHVCRSCNNVKTKSEINWIVFILLPKARCTLLGA